LWTARHWCTPRSVQRHTVYRIPWFVVLSNWQNWDFSNWYSFQSVQSLICYVIYLYIGLIFGLSYLDSW
jgi:hypothetical protein